jgi:hypothetical protein
MVNEAALVEMEGRRRMAGSVWVIWLQRALVAVVLLITGIGLGYVGLVWVVPSAETSLAPTVPAYAAPLGRTTTIAAAPTPTPAAPVRTSQASLREVQRVELPGQSSDGPALWVRSSSATGSPAASPAGASGQIGGVLAWTDTGRYHRLHLMTSADGLHFDHELLLPANAISRPSVVVAPVSTPPTAAPAEIVILAWTGTDPAHHLNVMYDALGAQRVLTLSEGSPDAPALALFAGQLWLAWTGSEPSHPLHIRPLALNSGGVVPGAETLLGDYQSLTAPALTADAQQQQLLLTWTSAAAGVSRLSLAASSDGLNWASAPETLPGASGAGSALLSLPAAPTAQSAATAAPPAYFWTWQGSDRWHAIKLTLAPTLHDWSAPITTLSEWCVGAPALGFAGGASQILLAWTGIDPGHHITLAVLQVDTSASGR